MAAALGLMARHVVLTPPTGSTSRPDHGAGGDDGPDGPRPDLRHRLGRMLSRGAPVLLPLVLFLVLQPETFSVAPNPLDPFFYSGLASNLDDVLAAGGDSHYFVSRWAAYLPMHVADAVAGPFAGRLILRLVIASVVLWGFWRLRPAWTPAQRLLTGTLIVSMPMFLRAFFTDYVEYAVVSYVAMLIVVSLRERQTWRSATVAGVLVGLVMVSNPIGLLAVVAPLAVLGFVGTRTWADRIRLGAIIGVATAATVAAGLLYFRLFLGVANVYAPTLEFMRTFSGLDPLRSPRHEWLWHFTWLWAAPLTLAVVGGLAVTRTVRFDRQEWSAFAIAASQYVLQCFDQFVRNGDGLEISYYWSMSYPSFAVAVGFLVARLTAKVPLPRAVAAVAAWCALLIVGVPDPLRLPAGVGLALITLAVGALVCLAVPRWPAVGAVVLVTFLGLTQIAAPPYDPSAYHPFNMSPRYDQLFWGDGDNAETLWEETVWFERQMDRVGNDAQAKFVVTSDVASLMVAVYHPQITGRRYAFDEQLDFAGGMDPAFAFALAGPVAFYGDPTTIDEAIPHLRPLLGLGEPVLDETRDGGLGFRLVVFQLEGSSRRPRTIEASRLKVSQGVVEGTDVVVRPGTPPGFVTFGPYVPLDPGRYTLTLSYTASAPPPETVGGFEAFAAAQGSAADVELPGTGGRPSEITLPFESVDGADPWEFRTTFTGVGSLTVDKITLEPAG